MKRRYSVFFLIIYFFAITFIWLYMPLTQNDVLIEFKIDTNQSNKYELLYTTEKNFSEDNFLSDYEKNVTMTSDGENNLTFEIPYNVTFIKLIFGEEPSSFVIKNVDLKINDNEIDIPVEDLVDVEAYKDISSYFYNKNAIEGISDSGEAYLVWNLQTYNVEKSIIDQNNKNIMLFHIIGTIIVSIVILLIWLIIRIRWGGKNYDK